MNIVGEIEGRTAIIIDDIIDTAGTITLRKHLKIKVLKKFMLVVRTLYYQVQLKNVLKTLQLKN